MKQTNNITVPLNDIVTFNHVVGNVGVGHISTGDDNGKLLAFCAKLALDKYNFLQYHCSWNQILQGCEFVFTDLK